MPEQQPNVPVQPREVYAQISLAVTRLRLPARRMVESSLVFVDMVRMCCHWSSLLTASMHAYIPFQEKKNHERYAEIGLLEIGSHRCVHMASALCRDYN